MLWVDKYRPTSLDKMELHTETNERLAALAGSGDLPHLLLYGPSGAGKKTRVIGLLKQVYGSACSRLKVEHKVYDVKSGSSKVKLEVTAITSPHHIELTPADCGVRDRLVVQEVLKDIAQSVPLEGAMGITRVPFKVVVLNEVDRLSRDAQAALRRTMERYTRSCRLILLANSTTKVIEPVRSRCLQFRIPAPSSEEVGTILSNIAKKENLNLPDDLKQSIIEQGNRNLRRAILSFETTRVQSYPFQPGQKAARMDWELYIADIAKKIITEQSPQCLLAVREQMYELLGHCIPPDLIMQCVTDELLKRVDSSMQPAIVSLAAFYEQRMQVGTKEIFHIEAFVAKVMSVYKRFLTSLGI